jgi:hypothetical protein
MDRFSTRASRRRRRKRNARLIAGGVALTVLGAGTLALGAVLRTPGPPAPADGGLVAVAAPAEPEPAVVQSLAQATAPAMTLDHSPAVHLTFPRMRIDTDLMVLDLDDNGEVGVPPDDPGAPAGWYGRGASPGEIGPTVILGHVDTRSGPGVFYGLGATKIADKISVERMDGKVAHYEVTRVVSYPQSKFPTDEIYGDTTASELRLITCGGRYDRAKGGYLDNIVVFAMLVDVT